MKRYLKKTTRIGFKITNILLTVAVMVILPMVVFTLISSKTDKLAGVKSFVVLTGSMEPNISVGSVIFTKPFGNYHSGDVIAFNKDGKTITHRVVNTEIKNKGISYTTKGDANNAADTGEVLGASVVGGQVFTVPYLGSFILFLSTVKGFALFIGFPITLFVLFELWNIKKEMEKQIEAKLFKEMFAQKP